MFVELFRGLIILIANRVARSIQMRMTLKLVKGRENEANEVSEAKEAKEAKEAREAKEASLSRSTSVQVLQYYS